MSNGPRLEDVVLLWVYDYWDGPLAGLAHHAGRDYWFEIEAFDSDDPPIERHYFLFELTDQELADEKEWHHRFQQHVGTHTDYDTTGRRDLSGLRPVSEWPKFYDEFEKRPRPCYTSRAPVGWFTL